MTKLEIELEKAKLTGRLVADAIERESRSDLQRTQEDIEGGFDEWLEELASSAERITARVFSPVEKAMMNGKPASIDKQAERQSIAKRYNDGLISVEEWARKMADSYKWPDEKKAAKPEPLIVGTADDVKAGRANLPWAEGCQHLWQTSISGKTSCSHCGMDAPPEELA